MNIFTTVELKREKSLFSGLYVPKLNLEQIVLFPNKSYILFMQD